MSTLKPQKTTLLVLTIAGVLFSGYLSGVKLFSKACAFGEACPYFLGLPACYFGFAMFLVMLIAAMVIKTKESATSNGLLTIITVSLLGIVFSGYFTIGELPVIVKEGFGYYTFGLPTCSLGLIFYIIIFMVSTFAYNKMPEKA